MERFREIAALFGLYNFPFTSVFPLIIRSKFDISNQRQNNTYGNKAKEQLSNNLWNATIPIFVSIIRRKENDATASTYIKHYFNPGPV